MLKQNQQRLFNFDPYLVKEIVKEVYRSEFSL